MARPLAVRLMIIFLFTPWLVKSVDENPMISPYEIEEVGTVTLLQSTPPENGPICPGSNLAYNCTSDGVALVWQEGTELYIFNNPEKTHTKKHGSIFTFELLDAQDGTKFVSRAYVVQCLTNYNGTLLTCTDGDELKSKSVLIPNRPGDCQGSVSCAVYPKPMNNGAEITITLNASGTLPQCVKSYEFEFQKQVKEVQTSSEGFYLVTFTIIRELSLTGLKHEIRTLNYETTAGNVSCPIQILAPNPIPVSDISYQLCCDGNIVFPTSVIFKWTRPSLPLDTCLDANQLRWEYNISFLNETFTTVDTSFTYRFSNLETPLLESEYNASITPVLSDLGLSGDPTTKVVYRDFPTSTTSGSVERTVDCAMSVLIMALVIDGVYLLEHLKTLF